MTDLGKQLEMLGKVLVLESNQKHCDVWSDCDNAAVFGECTECNNQKKERFKKK